jgi:hypothetical protein
LDRLARDLKALPTPHLKVLHRIAKTKLRNIFADPKAMIVLRNELEARND